jgi:hypothetical protein
MKVSLNELETRFPPLVFLLFFLFIFIALSLFAVSPQSLWIDEANSALKAIQPTLGSFWDVMVREKGSDFQMPGYMLALWGWEKVAGPSEWALRSLNVFWMGLGFWALLFRLRQPAGFRIVAAAVTGLSAFSWAYNDEARPYAMQIGAACLIAVALANLCVPEKRGDMRQDAFLAAAGAVLLSASSLIGAFFCGFYGAAFVVLWAMRDRKLECARTWPVLLAIAVSGALLAALAGYYFWTLKLGAGASDIGKTGFENVIFAIYELSGLSGLGPGRLEIRENGMKAFLPFLPLLSAGGLVIGATVVSGFLCGIKSLRFRNILLVGFLIVAAAGVFLVGRISGFRMLGRHLTPLFPFVAMAFAWCLCSLISRRKALGVTIASLFFATLVASAVTQRFHPRFAKDDYRSACHAAKAALDEGKVVWWAADGSAPKYYGTIPHAGHGQMIMVKDKTCGQLESLPHPQMVFLSKPDVYDGHGAIRRVISARKMTKSSSFTAFTVWGTVGGNQRSTGWE